MLHSIRSIARRFHVDPRLLRDEVASGRLPSVVIGRRRKVADTVLQRWLEGRLTSQLPLLTPPNAERKTLAR